MLFLEKLRHILAKKRLYIRRITFVTLSFFEIISILKLDFNLIILESQNRDELLLYQFKDLI